MTDDPVQCLRPHCHDEAEWSIIIKVIKGNEIPVCEFHKEDFEEKMPNSVLRLSEFRKR